MIEYRRLNFNEIVLGERCGRRQWAWPHEQRPWRVLSSYRFNPQGVTVRRLISQIADWLRLFRRAPAWQQPSRLQGSSPASEHAPRPSRTAPTVRCWYEPIDGAATRLVRPYLTAYEQEEMARIQRLRRDILWCATYGVDLDTRDIHACPAAAS
ncbi:hypothetical protein AB0D80_23530 [Streptomyces tendae]|uniref:hypothetical protein n=1 Tax=Streptomyces tendae TaxID=1932 RepID=UPI0033F117D4